MKAINMKNSGILIVAVLGILAGQPAGIPAVLAADDAGVPGGFLRFGASARSLSLGNAVAGLSDDVATSYWNPAGLAQLRTMEVTAMGATMFNDTKYSFFAMGLPTEKWGTFALNGTYTSSGEFERSTWDQDLGETFSETEGIFSLGYANNFGRLAFGLNLKSVSQDIGGASGSSTGLDAGVFFRPHRLLSVGASVQNLIEPKITLVEEEEKLARSMRAGLALRFFRGRMLVTSDIVKTEFMDTSYRSGLELWALRSLGLRAGYDGQREHISAGAGFRSGNWQFDYAYVATDLGAQNVVSATLRFGVPFGVKTSGNRTLFSPSGEDRDVRFAIETAVRGQVESWRMEIRDESGRIVRTMTGNGPPPGGISWGGENEEGRLVGDGHYDIRVSIVDHMGQEWDHDTSVEVMGFKDRTRAPIRVEISGNSSEEQ